MVHTCNDIEMTAPCQRHLEVLINGITQCTNCDDAIIYSTYDDIPSCQMTTFEYMRSNSDHIKDKLLNTVMNTKKSIVIDDVNCNSKTFNNNKYSQLFNPTTDDHIFNQPSNKTSLKTKCTCVEPIYSEQNQFIGMIQLFYNTSNQTNYTKCILENQTNYQLFKSMINLVSITLARMTVKREYNDLAQQKQALLELSHVVGAGSGHNIEDIIERVRNTVYKYVGCDKVAFFLIDEHQQELWCKASDDVAGIRLPINAGIVGHCVVTGESLNIKDAYQDKRFNRDVDKQTNYRTKTILCVPIIYKGKIIGAMECINKLQQNFFTNHDLLLLTQCAEECAPILQSKFRESALRLIFEGLDDSTAAGYLSQYITKNNTTDMDDESSIITVASVASSFDTPDDDIENAQQIARIVRMCNSEENEFFQQLDSWDMDYFGLESKPECAIALFKHMLDRFNLITKYKISENILFRFLNVVRTHYYDNPYHNFVHAFNVVHVCYLILSQTTVQQHFTELEILTNLIAAICHDLEHRGLTNAYYVNSGSELALRYNDQSVLENHHAYVASMLLKKNGCNVLRTLSKKQQTAARKLMISIILHTDMTMHSDIVSQLSKCAEKLEELRGANKNINQSHENQYKLEDAQRNAVVKMLVHLADLSNPVLSWNTSYQCSVRVVQEFYDQSQLEKEQGLPVQEFMTKKDNESLSKLQISFIDYVVKPFWKTARRLIPELEPRLQILESNRTKWSDLPNNIPKINTFVNDEKNYDTKL